MPEKIPDLWPAEFGTGEITPPVHILREQANLLGKKTGGAVVGVVQTTKDVDGFIHTFYLRAPLLDNYSYRLFSVAHGIGFYPLRLVAAGLAQELADVRVVDKDQLLDFLRKILNDPKTKQVVQALRDQVEGAGVS
jgi:hypothetical protein